MRGEPSYQPDHSELDSPDDQLRQIASDNGLKGQLTEIFVRLVHQACQSGIVEKLPYGEITAQGAHEIIKRTIAIVGDSQTAALRCWCLDYLIGGGVFGGKSEIRIARRFGCTRANVSYIVKHLQKELGLGEPPGGKSREAVGVYRERAKRIHAEREKPKREESWHAKFFSIQLYGHTTGNTTT